MNDFDKWGIGEGHGGQRKCSLSNVKEGYRTVLGKQWSLGESQVCLSWGSGVVGGVGCGLTEKAFVNHTKELDSVIWEMGRNRRYLRGRVLRRVLGKITVGGKIGSETRNNEIRCKINTRLRWTLRRIRRTWKEKTDSRNTSKIDKW